MNLFVKDLEGKLTASSIDVLITEGKEDVSIADKETKNTLLYLNKSFADSLDLIISMVTMREYKPPLFYYLVLFLFFNLIFLVFHVVEAQPHPCKT